MPVVRVLQFADIINRYDFIDTIVRFANHSQFEIGVCVRTKESTIAAPCYDQSVPRWVLSGVSRWEMLRTTIQLVKILREWDVDILHTHHYDQAVIGWLATRLHPKTRLIIGRHYSDAIYRSTRGIKRHILLRLEQIINQAAARVISPSSFVNEILIKWQGVHPQKVKLVPYGFVPEKYMKPLPEDIARARAECSMEDRFVLGSFGRLHEEKGYRFLLQAVAAVKSRLPQLMVIIVGEGPERQALERQIHDLRLGTCVRLLGWRRDVTTLMAAVDAVIQPTLHEAFSQVMVESLWMRKPLIMTKVSGADDIIRDGENGLLVPPGESAALSLSIERLANDDNLRGRLGESGHAFVRDNLTTAKIIPQYEKCYLQTMQSSPRFPDLCRL